MAKQIKMFHNRLVLWEMKNRLKFKIGSDKSLNWNVTRGGKITLEIYFSKNIVAYSKTTQIQLEINDGRFYLSKSKKSSRESKY